MIDVKVGITGNHMTEDGKTPFDLTEEEKKECERLDRLDQEQERARRREEAENSQE